MLTFLLQNLDLYIFLAFLLVNLGVGLMHSRSIKNLRDYAVGDKDFSTAALVATIVATWHGGGSLFRAFEKVYSMGLYYTLGTFGIAVGLWLSGRLASRMEEFMHNVSVAEAMGDLYGKHARVITAVSSILGKTGAIAMQFKAISKILVALFGFDSTLATVAAASAIIAYSSSGGIKAVTLTDILQLLTFSFLIPIIALTIWSNVQGTGRVTEVLSQNPTFSFREVVSWTPEFSLTLSLFFYLAIPGFSPELFQRIVMARDVRQARRALTYAAGISLLIAILLSSTGFLFLADNPGLESSQVVPHMISKYTYVGFRGILGIGVAALAMSTADSFLNTCSILFANDIVKPLIDPNGGSIRMARYFSILSGFAALLLALCTEDLLKLLLLSGSLYMPIFTVPFLIAVLGFRSTPRAVLLGMGAGLATVIVWSFCYSNSGSVVPGMLANLIVLLGSHYLLGEPGGWTKAKPIRPVGQA